MDLYREGFLNKAGKGIIQTRLHSWRPRYFVLDGTSLKYYKTKEISLENMLGHILLSEVESVSLMKNEKNSFQITTKSPKPRTYYMAGKSEDEVMGWVRVLKLAKAKVEKRDAKNAPVVDNELYDEVKHPLQSPTPPPKPMRTPEVPSEYSLLGAVTTPPNGLSSPNFTGLPKADTSPDKHVPSQYEHIGPPQESITMQKSKNSYEESFSEDPTYDKVDSTRSEACKRASVKKIDTVYDEPSLAAGGNADLYDTVRDVGDRKRAVSEPPPLPSRHPTSSKDTRNATLPLGAYDEVRYELLQHETHDDSKEEPEEEKKGEPEAEGKMLPVYAKPLRKKISKKIVNPALIDIGEVSGDVEEESAGGRETLKMGMIEPIGDCFAVEAMKEFLDSCFEGNNNIDGSSEAKVVDFDVNQSESAFDVLKCFLEKYQ